MSQRSSSNDSLGGFLVGSSSSDTGKPSGPATVGGAEGEIYIRADGKKVRRVRKLKKSSSSVEGSPPVRSSASASGAAPSIPAPPPAEGEIYINQDGKKVRRVVRRREGSQDDSKLLSSFLTDNSQNNVAKGSAATVIGNNVREEVEIITRPDGKKVRRIRRITSKTVSGATSNNNNIPDADTNTSKADTASTLSRPNSYTEGEIYIRPDGKKVRRVRKPKATESSSTNAGASSRSLSGPIIGTSTLNKSKTDLDAMMSNTSSDTRKVGGGGATVSGASAPLNNFITQSPTASTKGLAATVAGERPTTEGEIYIRADGKKVRRVKRINNQTTAKPGEKVLKTMPDGSEIVLRPDGKKVLRRKKDQNSNNPVSKKTTSGAATVTGSPENAEERAPPQKAASVAEGEIYINKDGKKVRRVKKSSLANHSLAGDLEDKSRLNGFLVKNHEAPTGPATVSGERVESEIYIRPDGKKVRRIRRIKSSLALEGSSTPLSSTLENGATSPRGAATVSGEQIIKSTPEGDVILRDGKKILRRRKTPTDTEEGEVYRRADGKLVRRVRRPAPDKSAAGDLAGFLDEKKGPAPKGGNATVAGGETASILKSKENQKTSVVKSTIELSPEKEERATSYRKMLKMGLPADAVQHKMNQDQVDPLIIAAVLGLDPPAEKTGEAKSGTAGVSLSNEEEAVAAGYRKMLKMGLPADAVRHKMSQDGITENILAAVLGEEPSKQEESENSPSTLNPNENRSDDSVSMKYVKMLKMGLPSDTVRHKMVQDGVDESTIGSVLGESPSGVAFNVNEEIPDQLSKYKKMVSMGLPPDAVRHKMMQEGIDEETIGRLLGGDSEPVTNKSSSPVSEEEAAIIEKYQKMLKMGLPGEAVKHKMTQDGIEEKLVRIVFGEPTDLESNEAAPESSAGWDQTEIDEVEKYRKMIKMGLPAEAVKHKMSQDGVNPKIMKAALSSEDLMASSHHKPTESNSVPESSVDSKKAPAAVSYIVTVSDEPDDATTAPSVVSKDALRENEGRFAVTVGSINGGAGGETRYLTLDEIARMSGQSVESLQKSVKDKAERGDGAPSFILEPLSSSERYAVNIPVSSSQSVQTRPGEKVASIRDGQEVVDSELARAARAVSALGDLDMQKLLDKLQKGDMGELLERLREAEKRQKKLEKQLMQAGVAIAEDIDYTEAKVKVEQIAKRMNEIGGSDVTAADKEEQNRLREEYFKLEQEMERYNTALMLTEEYQAEQERVERQWEESNLPGNVAALKMLRRHMPVKIRHMSEAELASTPTPNGKFLPRTIAKKFKRTNVLQLLRLNPDDIERMHPSTLENMRVTGLTLTERRALYEHLRVLGPRWEKNKAEKMTERKWTWYQMMKNNFKENLAPYLRHVAQYGPPENHPYATRDNPDSGCPLIGKQCPIKADKIIDYDNDYGFTDEAEYEVSEVRKADTDDPGAKAMQEALELMREKKANERADLLKKHYKGKLLQVSKANGSCEAMDESMDKMENHMLKWYGLILGKNGKETEDDQKKEVANFTEALNELKLATLDFAQRSGMQTSGKKKAGGDKDDIRSPVECGLSEEVCELSQELFSFMRERLKQTGIRDTRVTKTIELLETILSELHSKNLATLEKLGVKRPDRSRKLKKKEDIKKEAQDKLKPPEEESPAEETAGPGPPIGGPGRGGLMDAIKGGRGRGPPGRGGLLDAIKGGRGRGPPGRGGLLDSIKAGRGRGGPGGGRGGLLAAIEGRGGGEGQGGDGGRGGLMAAIQARGRGGGPPGAGGGRGGLLAAIQARGGGGD